MTFAQGAAVPTQTTLGDEMDTIMDIRESGQASRVRPARHWNRTGAAA